MTGQLTLFSAGATDPDVDHLDGLLVGPGSAVRRGDTARVSVLIREDFRVVPLLAAFDQLGLPAEAVPAATDGVTVVRTGFEPALAPLARRWLRGAVKAAPRDLVLDGWRLRWWCLAAGHTTAEGGYLLRLGPSDEAVWTPAGAALAAAGLPGALLGPRGAGPAYRLVGRRRLTRLAELVGVPPTGLPAAAWPARGTAPGRLSV